MADDPNAEALIERASRDDRAARDDLFRRYRVRLKQMVVIRMDRRLAARVAWCKMFWPRRPGIHRNTCAIGRIVLPVAEAEE